MWKIFEYVVWLKNRAYTEPVQPMRQIKVTKWIQKTPDLKSCWKTLEPEFVWSLLIPSLFELLIILRQPSTLQWTTMSSGFISEAEILENRKLRQEEWDRVRTADQPLGYN